MNIGTFELEVVRDLINEARSLKAELAASQAREKVLRDGLQIIAAHPANEPNRTNWDAIAWEQIGFAEHALTAPTDDTALRQAIRAAKEEMRERCAKVCDKGVGSHDQTDVWNQGYDSASRAHAAAIRSLEVE